MYPTSLLQICFHIYHILNHENMYSDVVWFDYMHVYDKGFIQLALFMQ